MINDKSINNGNHLKSASLIRVIQLKCLIVILVFTLFDIKNVDFFAMLNLFFKKEMKH